MFRLQSLDVFRLDVLRLDDFDDLLLRLDSLGGRGSDAVVDRPVVRLWDCGFEAVVDRLLVAARTLDEDAVRSLVVRRIRTSAAYTAS